MITPQHVVKIVLAEAAKAGRADETMVLVTDKVEATLRWANNYDDHQRGQRSIAAWP